MPQAMALTKHPPTVGMYRVGVVASVWRPPCHSSPMALTDRGSCFTAEGFEAACRKLGVQHRKTKPYTPQTNDMVERFNGRIGREVLVMCIGTHDALERLLRGYNLAYNARRQRVVNSQSPDQVVQTRLQAKPQLVDPAYQPPSPCDRTKIKVAAQLIVHNAEDVSHPDTLRMIKA